MKAYTVNGRAHAQDTARTSVNRSRAPLWTRAWEGSEPTSSPQRETRSKQSVFTDFVVSSTKNKT